MNNFNTKAGINIIVALIMAAMMLFMLSYYNISIKSVMESPTGQENINYVGGGAINLWNQYLSKPVNDLWNSIQKLISTQSFHLDLNNFTSPTPQSIPNSPQ